MLNQNSTSWFASQVLTWFDQYGRKDFPWKQVDSPYYIWLSEIMLQQTQVTTVIPYFKKFIDHFDNIKTLANAKLDDVLSLWAGLGYYARARNLHKTAILLKQQHNCLLPNSLEALTALPGIGLSTAGAILAQSYNIRAPILDGNVKRVLSRFYAVASPQGTPQTLKHLWQLSEAVTPYERVNDYTQGIMDIGALICKRSQPNCPLCPLQTQCQAFITNKTLLYPTPKIQKIKPQKNTRFLMALNDKQEILLVKRPNKGIWGGLWCLPECENEYLLEDYVFKHYGIKIIKTIDKKIRRHTFTHYHLDYKPILARVKISEESSRLAKTNQKWYKLSQAVKLGLPAPHKNLLNNLIRDNS